MRFIFFKKNSEDTLEKGRPHLYIRKIPTGKVSNPWYYIYENTFKKPFSALKNWFGITEKKIDSDYEKNNISRDYGVDKKTFAAHVLEFFSNKDQWNKFFLNKANRDKNKKPVKQSQIQPKAAKKLDGSEKTKPANKEKKSSFINHSLMRKVWTIYSPQAKAIEEKEKEKPVIDNIESNQAPSDVIATELLNRENITLKYDGSDKNTLRIHRKISTGIGSDSVILGNVIPEYDDKGNITGSKLVTSTSYFDDWAQTKKQILEYYNLTKPNEPTNQIDDAAKKSPKKEVVEALKNTLKETGYIPDDELNSLSIENVEDMKNITKQIQSVPGLYDGDHTAMLHYFTPDTDYYITELGDDGEAYGYVDKNGDPTLSEYGDINIKELVNVTNELSGVNKLKGAQIDLHFTPKPIVNLIKDNGHDELYNHYVSIFEEEKLPENVAVTEPEEKETEEEKHKNRSEAMEGNENAKKDNSDENKELTADEMREYAIAYYSSKIKLGVWGKRVYINGVLPYGSSQKLYIEEAPEEVQKVIGRQWILKEKRGDEVYDFANEIIQDIDDALIKKYPNIINCDIYQIINAINTNNYELLLGTKNTEQSALEKARNELQNNVFAYAYSYNTNYTDWLNSANSLLEIKNKYNIPDFNVSRNKKGDWYIDVLRDKYNISQEDYNVLRHIGNVLIDKYGENPKTAFNALLNTANLALKVKEEESEAEKHQNRSEAMMGNDNAKKDGMTAENDDGGNANGNINTKSDGLSGSTGEVQSGADQTDSGSDVLEAELGDDTGKFVQQSREPGIGFGATAESSGVTVGTGRLTKSEAKKIREKCRQILAKPDSEITDKDKEILSQYEGAGGLHEGDQTNAAVLSEFYTPRDVISKVWELVDKYNPNPNKKVIEPSSGTGRFAEGRNENFTLCEIDETSSRIAKLLHPGAEVKQGSFQELFVKNNVVQGYKGEKYDVAVGNPPYGEYTGLYKGLGEGKIHTRYEEYFIDRTLDTLKDGGILAFVVPSGFLRGKDSKAKQAIASKGKLLEAWRLPKGTFSSTDVGTDVIIMQKGKGNIADFNDNNYFTKNENHVIGNETDGGNWGTKVINLPEGKTVAEAIQMIDVNAVGVSEDIAKAAANVNIVVDNSIKKQFTVVGSLKVGSEIITNDGKKGKITLVNQKNGMIGYAIDNGPIGRTKIDDFEVADDKETAEEIHKNRSEAMEGNENAKKAFHKERAKKAAKGDIFVPSTGVNMTAEEFNKKYAKNIPEADLVYWKATDWEGKIKTSTLSDKELAELDKNPNFVKVDNEYMSVVNYASGNIYKKLNELEYDHDNQNITDEEYETRKALLENALPQPKTIEQFTVSPIANFAKSIKNEDGLDLKEQFLKYCGFDAYGNTKSWGTRNISQNDLEEGMVMRDIWEYCNQVPVRAERAFTPEDKETAKMQAEQRKTNRREVTERLFNDWLRKLPEAQQKEIEKQWNERFNAIVNPDFEKIPLFVEGMNTKMGNVDFTLTEQQIKGVSELCNKGNGILAYDVGVGKTVTGIVATVNQMQTGKAKRPMICVPKAVYKNWIKEIKQHFPEVQINELNNFSEKDLGKYRDKDGNINLPENAINLCTYEALQKITFKKETLEGDLKDDMLDSQSIYDYDENGNLVKDTRTDRERAAQEEKLMKMLGQSAKAKEGAVFWEDLGIDHITVDELHNFKNIFSIPRTMGKSIRQSNEKNNDSQKLSNEYQGLNGASSSRGMKMFAISQLIQRQTNGKGFFGLSATPFNNSPVEIYNILSLVARNRLKDLGVYNLQDFLREYAEMKPDWKVKADGTVESELVMKNFKNLGALQNLITEFIDKVDGEEAGCVRPYKRVHKPQLDLTDLQKTIMATETARIQGEFKTGDSKDDSADTLVAMNNMRMATLSPSLIDPKFYGEYKKYAAAHGLEWRVPKAEDIVTESPKLQFVCDLTGKQYNARPDQGQVIYMPRGVKQYNFVKDYLVKQGIPADAIAFMDSSTTLDKKEKITSDFNDPNGKIKVIIGSETIKEGVNLNGNSSTIYNTMLGWNPTETIQVEGRVWRQGNRQGVTHVVYPLMNDSIDSMMYQKYDEKSSRLNALWSYKGDSLNVEDVNPEELKFELIKDPVKRADLQIKQQTADMKKEKKLLNAKYDNVYLMQQQYHQYEAQIKNAELELPAAKQNIEKRKMELEESKKTLESFKKMLKKDPENKDIKYSVEAQERRLDDAKSNLVFVKDYLRKQERTLKDGKESLEAVKRNLERQGVNNIDEVDGKLEQISQNRQVLEKQLDDIEKQRAQYVAKARKDIENQQRQIQHYSIDDRVNHYATEIANDLRPFAGVKTGIIALREMSANQIQSVIDTIKKDGSAQLGGDTYTSRDIQDLNSYKKKATVKKSFFVIKDGKFMIVQKSLTYSGHKLQGRTKFSGMDISIENKKGSVRSGVDDNGHEWNIKMNYDYGYIRGTEGVDGDHVDCYIGPNENAENVYIVHQNNPDTKKYDEDKCMLGFDDLKQAKAAYLSQYDRPGFLGDISKVPVSIFKEKIKQKKYKGKKLDDEVFSKSLPNKLIIKNGKVFITKTSC